MSSILPKPKVKAPTPAAPDPVTGAEDLKLGVDAPAAASGGMLGRLRLRTSKSK